MWLCFLAEAQLFIPSKKLEVSANKTTNLIFPSTINSVDRGSERIMVQKSTGYILRVKADTAFSDTTNLTVITTDGKLYSFLVHYNNSPEVLNVDLSQGISVDQDTALVSIARKVGIRVNNIYGIHYRNANLLLSLLGLYSTGELIFVKLKLENASTLSFEFGRWRVFAGVTNTSKRRPSQQIEVNPLLIFPYTLTVKEKQAVVVILVLPKAALGNGQALQLHANEKNAERQLLLTIPNKFLLNAKLIQ
ncbi:MAG: DUF4138 domain-containing protein [Chitinophagaceae bacterium]|nr:DUF4138 domain-containing protein [Chitinophagaceae bacterium]MCA6448109.1 DUF4138 domain-containing protein [Chitinophagaceae bacterium]